MIVVFTLLIICVIVLSGFADSSGAITGCVLARSMTPEGAVRLAAVCTFFGGIVITRIDPRVAMTFYGIASLGENSPTALLSLCCALLTAILWSLFAHSISIPTSVSHALLSGLTGAALAQSHSFSAISREEWQAVFIGFILSTLPACVFGFIFNGVLRIILARLNRRAAIGHFRRSQRWSTMWNAALCGAQDSQKFTGVYMLGLSLSESTSSDGKEIPLSVLLICTAALTLGTLLGASRIIKRVGGELCELDAHEYSAAGAAASFTVTACTLLGLPADLLQSRACAFLGAGLCHKKRSDLRPALQMLGAWLLTFPVCVSLGFLLSETAAALPFL